MLIYNLEKKGIDLFSFFVLKTLLVGSFNDFRPSFNRRLLKILSCPQFSDGTGPVKLLLKTLKRLFNGLVLFYVNYDHYLYTSFQACKGSLLFPLIPRDYRSIW